MKYAHLPAEERNDWILFKHHGSEAARRRLVCLYARQHEHLAIWAYRRIQHYLPPHDAEDGIQAARLFLIEAMDKYNIDHPLGVRFSTFATHHITGNLRKYGARVLRQHPLETGAVAYEELTEGWEVKAGLVADDIEAPILSEMVMEAIIRAAKAHLTQLEFRCFDCRFLRHQSLRTVEQELKLTYGETRSLCRRVQKRLRQLLAEAGLVE